MASPRNSTMHGPSTHSAAGARFRASSSAAQHGREVQFNWNRGRGSGPRVRRLDIGTRLNLLVFSFSLTPRQKTPKPTNGINKARASYRHFMKAQAGPLRLL